MKCGYKISSVVLLCSQSCYIRLDSVAVMSVHISACAGCDFDTCIIYVKLWQI